MPEKAARGQANPLEQDIQAQGKERYVRNLFDSIARYYDLMNLVMTGGLVKWWHRSFLQYTGLKPGGRALDVACGTGDLTLLCARQVGPGGRVIGLDFSPEMLSFGRIKVERAGLTDRIELVQGDAMNLPYSDNTFDCASIGFALRNVADIQRVLNEMARVVKPGGRVISLEISKPKNPLIRWPYFLYFYNVVPLIDKLLARLGGWNSGGVRPYTYLPHSLTKFPDQDRLAAMFAAAGLEQAGYKGLTGGVVSLHFGTKPTTSA